MHLIILYCSYIWSNAHYYSLAWVEQIILDWLVAKLCLYLFLCFCQITQASVWIQNSWEETTPSLKQHTTTKSIEVWLHQIIIAVNSVHRLFDYVINWFYRIFLPYQLDIATTNKRLQIYSRIFHFLWSSFATICMVKSAIQIICNGNIKIVLPQREVIRHKQFPRRLYCIFCNITVQ